MWTLALLGSFDCRDDQGSSIAIRGKKARGVLAYLALSRGKRAPRQDVADKFWSSSGEVQARQSLRQCLSTLRKALHEPLVEPSRGGQDAPDLLCGGEGEVALCAEAVTLDVDRVLAATQGDDEAVLAAVPLVRGPLLPAHVFGEDPADDWLRQERHRLDTACQQVLFRAAELHERAGREEPRLEALRRILELNPPCEEAHRALMRAYVQAGRRSDALAQFRACEDALARHLDAVVSSETQALFDELRLAFDTGGPPSSPRPPTLPLPNKPAIAVLAFDNLSGDPDKDYLGRGFSEDVTTCLSQFSSLFVIARNSAFAVSGQGLSVVEIGRRLGVHYVLEGSLQTAGDHLRVNAQLIEAEHGGHVWSEIYDGRMDEVFAFRDDIAKRIVATTAGRIEADALARAKRKATSDLDAFDCVLRGKYHHHRHTFEDSERAVELFERAVELSPEYALAHGWLACAKARKKSFGMTRAKKVNSEDYMTFLRNGLTLLQKGAGADSEESECLRLIGEVYLFLKDYDEAERHIAKAYRYNPNDDQILAQLSALHTFCGDLDEAVDYAQRSIRANPYHPGFYAFNLGRSLLLLGRYEEAIEALRRAEPQQNRYRAYQAACWAALGDDDQASRLKARILEEDPGFTLSFFRATFLFRDPARGKMLLELMSRAGLPP